MNERQDSQKYAYSERPTRNPLRYLLALWRSVRDLNNTYELGIVEIGFARSKFARRFARWGDLLDSLRSDPRTAEHIRQRPSLGYIDLDELLRLPPQSLGRVFAEHCKARALDPNLVRIPPNSEIDWLLNELYQTHDIWHVVTGWGNDDIGETGLAGFYTAQLGAPSFFALILAVIFLNSVFAAPRSFPQRIEALVSGYQAGKRAEPLLPVDWKKYWSQPVAAVRTHLSLDGVHIVGEGIKAVA